MIKLKALLQEQDNASKLPDELIWLGKEDLQQRLIELGADQYPANPMPGREIPIVAYTFGVNNPDNRISLIDPISNQLIEKTDDVSAWFREDGTFTLILNTENPETGQDEIGTFKGASYKLLRDGRIHCKLSDPDFFDMIINLFGGEAKTTGDVYIGRLTNDDILYAQMV
jgi:hypothetical protein